DAVRLLTAHGTLLHFVALIGALSGARLTCILACCAGLTLILLIVVGTLRLRIVLAALRILFLLFLFAQCELEIPLRIHVRGIEPQAALVALNRCIEFFICAFATAPSLYQRTV